MFGYPVTTAGGKYEIVKGLELNDFATSQIAATQKELQEEQDGVRHLL